MQQFSATAFQATFPAWAFVAALAVTFAGCRQEEVSTYNAPKETVATPPAKLPAASPPAPLRWTTPAGWEEQPASGMRVATFNVSKNGQRADVSIIPLAGVSGSELDNVNRWRGQVGLEPVDADRLGASAEKVAIGNTPASLHDLAGTDPQTKQPARILASILSAGGTTWFFKMTGPDALVAEQRDAFRQLLASINFQADSPQEDAQVARRPVSTNLKEIPGAAARDGKPVWEVPAGWQEQPASSMRLASFLVTGENGAKADMSVIKLSGMAGGTLANVNRWRSQIGLEPVDEAGLAKLITTREVAGTKVILVDMAGKSVETGEPARLLSAIVPHSGATWFYKLLGNDALVAQQKAAFIKFVESARYPNA